MPILHVRNVPQSLYDRIRELAAGENHSISAEVITLLELALQDRERRLHQRKVLSAIKRRRFSPGSGTPESTDLLDEDREE